ncbi:MAG: EAL domain-containing protein [Gammaproteobacteria bacterium]
MQEQQTADRQVRLEKFRLLSQTLPQSISFGAALALTVVVVLWRTQPTWMLLGWFTTHVTVNLWRLSVLRRFRTRHTDVAAGLRLAPTIQVGCAAAGLVWGLLALLPYAQNDLNTPLFVAFVLAGVTAGGATAMASEMVAALAFQFSIFALLALHLLLGEGDPTRQAMTFSALLYSLFMAAWTSRMHRNALAAIHTQLDGARRERELLGQEARYRALAHHDALTGLPNRLSLQLRLPELLAQAAAEGHSVAVIYIDLDRFKDINDLRGHRCGDALLQAAARRLRDSVRATDFVARMGGDEFVIATTDAKRTVQIVTLIDLVSASLKLPVLYEGEVLTTSGSMGIAVYPEHGADAEQLLKNADIALYQAKAAGRGKHRFFADEMSVEFRERMFLEQELARAVGTAQLFVEYQPLFDLSSGRPTGLEALLRWRHPQRGLVPPKDFIAIAEHCGLIEAIGAHVLRIVCADLRDWQRAGVPMLPVAINVSPIQLERGSLVESLLLTTREHQVSPTLLQIEITETALMKDTGQVAATLQTLREQGVKIMIDDFGIGFSSLNHLKNLAIDGLKIDQSFVADMIDDERDAAIVSAIIGIGKSLNMDVLAEGVHSPRHVQRLLLLGCTRGQGFFLHEPVQAAQCALFLARDDGRPLAATGTVGLAH